MLLVINNLFDKITIYGVPEYMEGIVRFGSVIAENGNETQDYQKLVNNTEFHSTVRSFKLVKLPCNSNR